MRFIIYGAGAIGGTIGARLFQKGYGVQLIARGAHLDVMKEHGLTFKSPVETVALPIDCVGHPSEISFQASDIVLMTMKAQDSHQALRTLRDAAGPNIAIVCAQNGVANERMALRLFPRVYGMTVFVPATHLEPGVVQTEAKTTTGMLDVGCYPTGVDETTGYLAEALTNAGFSCLSVADVMRWKYAKLVGNLRNALGALCSDTQEDTDVGDILTNEALECYRAAGIEWAGKEEVAQRRTGVIEMGPVDGKERPGSSSWQSVARGAGSIETDFLNGEVVLLGRLHGVPTPANAALQTLANRMIHAGTAAGGYSAEQLRAAIGEEKTRA